MQKTPGNVNVYFCSDGTLVIQSKEPIVEVTFSREEALRIANMILDGTATQDPTVARDTAAARKAIERFKQ